jgi:hypothetical protein
MSCNKLKASRGSVLSDDTQHATPCIHLQVGSHANHTSTILRRHSKSEVCAIRQHRTPRTHLRWMFYPSQMCIPAGECIPAGDCGGYSCRAGVGCTALGMAYSWKWRHSGDLTRCAAIVGWTAGPGKTKGVHLLHATMIHCSNGHQLCISCALGQTNRIVAQGAWACCLCIHRQGQHGGTCGGTSPQQQLRNARGAGAPRPRRLHCTG